MVFWVNERVCIETHEYNFKVVDFILGKSQIIMTTNGPQWNGQVFDGFLFGGQVRSLPVTQNMR